MIKSSSTIPSNSIIANDYSEINYCDSYSLKISTNDTVDKITAILFEGPKWMDKVFAPWYKFIELLGINTMRKEPAPENPYFSVGDKAVMFTVTHRNENEIVMGEHENILDFSTSVIKETSGNESTIHLTTIVKYNNFWGKLYFFPVKPFHRLICRQILKSYKKTT